MAKASGGRARGASSWPPSMRAWWRSMRRAASSARTSARRRRRPDRRFAQQAILRRRIRADLTAGHRSTTSSWSAPRSPTTIRPWAPVAKCVRFDVRSGALRWTWNPVPQDPAGSRVFDLEGWTRIRSGGANTWSIIAADPKRDLVFLPTTSPAVDYYGVTRLGDNRYANSVVALRASTGKLVWHFQTVHHDLWDYDNAAPPALITLPDGKDAVLQAHEDRAALRARPRDRRAAVSRRRARRAEERRARREDFAHPAAVGPLARVSHAHGGRHLGRDARGSGRVPRALRHAALRRALHAAVRARQRRVARQHRRRALGWRFLRHATRHRHRA